MFIVIQFSCDNSLAIVQQKDIIKGDAKISAKVYVSWGKNKKEWEGVVKAVTEDKKAAETQLKVIKKMTQAMISAAVSQSTEPSTSEQSYDPSNANKRIANLLQENGELS